jgi:hypothetical protein
MNKFTGIPAQYSKYIASLIGLLITYLQFYGATWHLVPAVTAFGAALAVLGVPNASKTATATADTAFPIPHQLPPRS